jgi:hypothetical protein
MSGYQAETARTRLRCLHFPRRTNPHHHFFLLLSLLTVLSIGRSWHWILAVPKPFYKTTCEAVPATTGRRRREAGRE